MRFSVAAIAIFAFVGALAVSGVAAAQVKSPRTLSAADTRIAIEALVKTPEAALSNDPSCKSDLGVPGDMSIGQGLGVALIRAITDKKPVSVTASCFVRTGYPIAQGQEFCRLAFNDKPGRPTGSYGLVFLMDWSKRAVVAGSVECY